MRPGRASWDIHAPVRRLIVTETGAVQDIKVEQSGGAILDDAVIDAVRNWKFEPATKRGVRVKIQHASRQRFKLGR